MKLKTQNWKRLLSNVISCRTYSHHKARTELMIPLPKNKKKGKNKITLKCYKTCIHQIHFPIELFRLIAPVECWGSNLMIQKWRWTVKLRRMKWIRLLYIKIFTIIYTPSIYHNENSANNMVDLSRICYRREVLILTQNASQQVSCIYLKLPPMKDWVATVSESQPILYILIRGKPKPPVSSLFACQ